MAWSVLVGNLGTVLETEDAHEARITFCVYREASTIGYGRVGGECVTLFDGEEISEEYIPTSAGCPECEALMINGTYCHEAGCPADARRRRARDVEDAGDAW